MRFGIEEEYFVVEPGSGRPADLTNAQRGHLLRIRDGGSATQPEWMRFQFEFATPICATAEEAVDSLTSYRSRFAAEVADMGYAAVSMGSMPDFVPGQHLVSPEPRYRTIADHVPGLAAEQSLSGQHVHIEIPSREAGVQVLNHLRRWLPVITALAANSCLWRGADSGFASWRTIHYRRWIIQGVPPHFASGSDYTARTASLLATPGVLDDSHIGWVARLSTKHPTVEVRCADSQATAAEAVVIALIVRALAMRALDSPGIRDDLRPELADLAMWHAAKYGLTGDLLRLPSGAVEPAATLLAELWEVIGEGSTDDRASEMMEERRRALSADGNGAERQRRAFARGGVDAVVTQAAAEFI